MSDVREAIRAKIKECVPIITQLRGPAERIIHAREMSRYYSSKDDPSAIARTEMQLEEAARAAQPMRERLVKLLREIVEMEDAADKAGFDPDFTGIKAFIERPDATNAHTLEGEFELVERQLSFDPIPTAFSVEELIESAEISEAKSKQITHWLENELRSLDEVEERFHSAMDSLKMGRSNRDYQWRVKVAQRELTCTRKQIQALSRVVQRRLMVAGISTPLDRLYSLIADWSRSSFIPEAIKEVMWAGDQLAVAPTPVQPVPTISATLPDGKWRERPFDESCTVFVDPDQGLIQAMRNIVPDWNGNWDTVEAILRPIGYSPAEFQTLTVGVIRQAIALHRKPLMVKLAGPANTTESTVLKLDIPPFQVRETIENALDATPGPALSNRKQLVLQALLSLRAFNSDSRKTTSEVAKEAEGNQANPQAFAKPVSELKRSHLVESREGRDGGIWLTRLGRERAEALSKL